MAKAEAALDIRRVSAALGKAADAKDEVNADQALGDYCQVVYLLGLRPKAQQRLLTWFGRRRRASRSRCPLKQALLELGRGILHWGRFLPQKAMKSFQQAESLCPARAVKADYPWPVLKAFALSWKGTCLMGLSRYKQAIALAAKGARAVSHIAVATNCHGWSCLIRGKAAYAQGRHQVSQEWFSKARHHFVRMGNEFGLAELGDAQAKLALEKGRYVEARDHLTHALRRRTALAEEGLEDRVGMAKAYLLLGRIYRYEGNHEESLAQYEFALKIAEASGRAKLRDVVTHFKGDAHLALGNVRQAQSEYRKCLRSSRRRADEPNLRHSRYSLAKALWRDAIQTDDSGRRTQLLDSALKRCLAILTEISRSRNGAATKIAAKVELLTARIYSAMGAAKAAQQHYTSAAKSFRKMEMVYDETETLCECGRCLSQNGHHADASRYLIQALDACVDTAQRARALEVIRERLLSAGVEVFRHLAQLEDQRAGLEERLNRTARFYSATLEVLDARDFAFWVAVFHAKSLEAAKELCVRVWSPIQILLGHGEPLSIEEAPLSEMLRRLKGPAPDTLATFRTPPRPPKLRVLADERYLVLALRRLGEVLAQLSVGGATPIETSAARKRGARDTEITLVARGRQTDEGRLAQLMSVTCRNLRPSDVGLRNEDWPRLIVSRACIVAMDGTIAFASTPEAGSQLARNEFRISLPSA